MSDPTPHPLDAECSELWARIVANRKERGYPMEFTLFDGEHKCCGFMIGDAVVVMDAPEVEHQTVRLVFSKDTWARVLGMVLRTEWNDFGEDAVDEVVR